MADIQETIAKRSKDYGNYRTNIQHRVAVMETLKGIYKANNEETMPLQYEHYLWDVVNKLMRCATNPTHIDSWHDLGGYALLIEKGIQYDLDCARAASGEGSEGEASYSEEA